MSRTVTQSEFDSEFDDLKSDPEEDILPNNEPQLSIEDHLTNKETLNFWKRYFGSKLSS